jgi:5-methylcytosine-specific restriction endonuclease McrA
VRRNYYSPKRRAIMARGEKINHTEVFDDHGWICHLCQQEIDPTASRDDAMRVTLDHIIPLSRGGEHVRSNVAPAHYRCNMFKGNTLPKE